MFFFGKIVEFFIKITRVITKINCGIVRTFVPQSFSWFKVMRVFSS